MPDCSTCGHETIRVRRNYLQKVYTFAIFKCPKCSNRMYLRRASFGALSRYAQCPQCGTRNLSKLKCIDRVDRMNKNPLRMLLMVVRAPLYHCTFCRLQFWDVRKRASDAKK